MTEQSLALRTRELSKIIKDLRRQLNESNLQLAAAQTELEATNQGLIELLMELDDRVATSTRELSESNAQLVATQVELQVSNREIMELTADLEDRVDARTAELQNLEEGYRALFDQGSTEYAIVALDLTGNIVAWNEGAKQNYGYSAEDMVGKQNFRILYLAADIAAKQTDLLMATALERGKIEEVFQQRRKNGSRFTASVAMSVRRDAYMAHVGYIVISKDITRQKAMEEQLRRKNEELKEQYVRAQEASRLKSAFLANMSHELRTPLNGILGYVELLHDGRVGEVNQKQKRYLGHVLLSAQHLLHLINDVLDLSRIESGTIKLLPERVDLPRLVQEVIDSVQTLAQSKQIEVQATIDPALDEVTMDPAKLKQILLNYLSNSLKFTPAAGNVFIRVLPTSAGMFRLDVEDTGIGIEPEDIKQLFVEFHQLDSSTSKMYAGTGLGLALTKRLVEAQGGRVEVISWPGKGSVFSAILPWASPATLVATAHATDEQGPSSTARPKIQTANKKVEAALGQ